MGAWIETFFLPALFSARLWSLPIWERGLKHIALKSDCFSKHVAPYMGAWIETILMLLYTPAVQSLPIWERGLKHGCQNCDLNLLIVAPYMGAWIETGWLPPPFLSARVAPYMVAWIETFRYSQI